MRDSGDKRVCEQSHSLDNQGDDHPLGDRAPGPHRMHPGRLASAITELLMARQEVCDRIAALDADRRTSVRQREALEVSLRLLDPNVELAGERTITCRTGYAGVELRGLTGAVMKALRLAPAPLSIGDVATVIIEDRGGDMADRFLRSIVRQRVGVCLRKMNIRGVVKRVGEHASPRWMVAPEFG